MTITKGTYGLYATPDIKYATTNMKEFLLFMIDGFADNYEDIYNIKVLLFAKHKELKEIDFSRLSRSGYYIEHSLFDNHEIIKTLFIKDFSWLSNKDTVWVKK